ncbi:cytosolic sulfotransferase 16-like [Durio zibethinus]|uniref:Sulfotransferase n=1 Tax=Durio zibethinus TaxID=66656 RepID=A0A6P5Z5E9_DURZI|nr:cytosolic sulfotransferase 16-like [Durio zibethinus]
MAMKALTLSILGHKNSISETNKQQVVLLSNKNPHELFRVLETEINIGENPSKDIILLPSPRVFNTHLSILPDHIENSGCLIVYVACHPADTIVSLSHVCNKQFGNTISLEEAFHELCQGFLCACWFILRPYIWLASINNSFAVCIPKSNSWLHCLYIAMMHLPTICADCGGSSLTKSTNCWNKGIF